MSPWTGTTMTIVLFRRIPTTNYTWQAKTLGIKVTSITLHLPFSLFCWTYILNIDVYIDREGENTLICKLCDISPIAKAKNNDGKQRIK